MNHISEPKWDFRDNFITVIDNAFTPELCDEIVNYFEKVSELGLTIDRQQNEGADPHLKQDDQYFFEFSCSSAWEITAKITQKLNGHFDTYHKKYHNNHKFIIEGMKIQKTLPGGGYHLWHSERGGAPSDGINQRAIVFTYYLNDVEEGGETEFLYQHQRVKPVKGRGVWFPAAYTHVHRGNPPLTNTKYLLTGWFTYSE